MDNLHFRRPGSLFSLATLIALVWSSVEPVRFAGSSSVALAATDPVIAAAGDVACDPSSSSFNGGNGTSGACRQRYTSDMLVNGGFAAVLPLGDIQYYCGGYQAWLQSYDLSWGRVKSITRPAVGNHEYLTSGGTDCTSANAGAAGYFRYFGAAAGQPSQGYYSYNVGAWHLVALNSNCSSAGGCGSTSPQGLWLKADLEANPTLCTLAYWHIPVFSSGGRASSNARQLWQILYDHGVEVVLNGHDHIYERFAPQTSTGTLDTARGIREFIVGTGGSNHTSLASIAANSLVRNTDTFGILKLTLHATSYDWQFVPEPGKTFTDSGSASCFGSGQPGITATPNPTSAPLPNSTNTPLATQVDTLPTQSFTFNPVADTYVNQSSATTNYGTSTQLRVDGSPLVQSYLRFDVRNVTGRITRATLRVYATSALSTGYDARAVTDNTWGETTVNYNNAPAFGNPLGVSGPVVAGGWNNLDVTSLITGNGLYSLALTTSSGTALSLASREAGANQSQLIVEAQLPTATPNPTNTPTRTASPTPTSSPTATLSQTATASRTATNTLTLTSTVTRTATSFVLPTKTSTAPVTPSSTQTGTATLPASVSDTPTASQTETPVPTSLDPAQTPTDTTTPSASETSMPAATDTATSQPSDPPTNTPMATTTQQDSETPTLTVPATDTAIPAVTHTETAQPALTATDSPVPTETPTATPMPAPTFTPFPTGTMTPTSTATNIPIPTSTRTATLAPSSTGTMSRTPTRTSTSAPAIRTFTPVVDSYVDQANPTVNYGASTQLRTDGSPFVRSYLRFNVQNLTGRVTRATLRIFANSAASSGCVANIVSNNTWTETGLTYNNAPTLGTPLGSSGSFGAGVWISMDVTAYITGNGTYSLAVTTPGSTAVSLVSREGGTNAPQLIVETTP